jgi:hypothetical protein
MDLSDDENAHIEAAWQAGATDLILGETYAIHLMPGTCIVKRDSYRRRVHIVYNCTACDHALESLCWCHVWSHQTS